jgi:hypothetical protein
MKLFIAERVALLNILPKEGSFLTYKAVQGLKDQLSASDEETSELGIKTDEAGHMFWNSTLDKGKEIEISETANNIIIEGLRKFNPEDENIPFIYWDLKEKFIPGDGE